MLHRKDLGGIVFKLHEEPPQTCINPLTGRSVTPAAPVSHMSAERRFMTLDRVVLSNTAFNDTYAQRGVLGRSVVSLVENLLVGIVGSCLVMPVARTSTPATPSATPARPSAGLETGTGLCIGAPWNALTRWAAVRVSGTRFESVTGWYTLWAELQARRI